VAPLLAAAGHRPVAIDLPGHGADQTPRAHQTLEAYVDALLRALDAEPEPVLLVGHSMGGVVITQAAERRPERIRGLIYVAAYLPTDGQSLLDLARADTDGLVLPNVVLDRLSGEHWVRPEAVREVFYGDCSAEDVAAAEAQLVRERYAPHATPVRITAERFGRVPRTFIEARRDRCVSLALQRRMEAASPCQRMLALDSAHSPWWSAPEALARLLCEEARCPEISPRPPRR
jgi:pimeloyl-ACP methyl ester carboxylesterase